MQPYNPYAAPVAENVYSTRAGVGGVWRDGDVAVCHKDAPWPDRCVKCNEPALGYRLERSLYWHPAWVYLMLLPGVLIYAIVALAVRKRATVQVGLCPRHRGRRRTGLLVGWLGMLSTIGSCSLGLQHDPGTSVLFGFLGFLVFMVVAIVTAQTVRPKKIDDMHAWVKCGKPFVESLPPAGAPPRW